MDLCASKVIIVLSLANILRRFSLGVDAVLKVCVCSVQVPHRVLLHFQVIGRHRRLIFGIGIRRRPRILIGLILRLLVFLFPGYMSRGSFCCLAG